MPSKKKKAIKALGASAAMQSMVALLAAKTPTTKAKSSKKNKSRAGKSGVRALNPSIIRSNAMNFRSTSKGVIVNGHENVEEVACSQYRQSTAISLFVDEEGGLLKRVSAFASVFQRYRFRSLQAHYRSAAPATRSGVLGVALSQSYELVAPTSASDVAAFENSFVTPVSTSCSSAKYRYDGNEWWDCDRSQFVDDPSKVVQIAILGYVGDCVSADDGAIAGYMELEYELEFEGMKPMRPTRYVGTGLADYANTAGSPKAISVVNKVNGDAGFVYDQNKFFADTNSATNAAKIVMDGAYALWTAYCSWGAAAVEAMPIDESVTPRLATSKVHCRFKSRAEAQKYEKKYESVPPPMAAGDIAFVLFSELDGQTNTIFSTTTSAGTGAVANTWTDTYQSVPGEQLWFRFAPTGSEVRTLDVSKSFVDICVDNGDKIDF